MSRLEEVEEYVRRDHKSVHKNGVENSDDIRAAV